MRHIKTLLVLTILATAFMVDVPSKNQTLAADFPCTTSTCPGIAQCSGDRWAQSGTCQKTCYRDTGVPGQIVFNGSANCSPPTGNGTGGGGGGGGGGESGGGYCYDNWFWDSNCGGDPYSLYEPWIN